MSILNGPRINFFGGIEVDVSVPNNQGTYPINGNNEAIFDPKTSTLTDLVYEQNITDDDLIAMLREPFTSSDGPYFTNGGWNIYGQHSVITNNVNISSGGSPGSVSITSPFVGFPMYLLGSANPDSGQTGVSSPVMVDLNPLGSLYSQIALGGLVVGDINNPLLHLQGDKIVGNAGLFRKIINREPDAPGSSMFAGSWQVTFNKSEIIAFGKSENSSANSAIEDFINTPGMTGIVINFSFFEMCPQMTTEELRKSYYSNQNERNPSVGRIVGTIGIAFDGEPAAYPDGRLLLDSVTQVPAYAYVNSSESAPQLSLDMLLALTQKDFRKQRDGYTASTIDPAINAGSLTLTAQSETIKTFTPNYEDYYKYGGIIDVPLTTDEAKILESNPLSVSNNGSATDGSDINLKEQAYRIFSSNKDVYVGEKNGDAQNVELAIRYLGKPIPNGITLEVSSVDLDGLNKEDYLDLSQNQIAINAGQTTAEYTLSVKAGVDAVAGWQQVQFAYQDAKFVINTRKFKYTDFNIPSGSTVTWDDVYKHNLRYHYLNFLGMSTVFPLNLAETIQQYRNSIKDRTSSKYWPTTLYMPIVRSMSPSQVRLLNAFAFNEPWNPDAEI